MLALTALGVAGCTAEQQRFNEVLARQSAALSPAIHQEHSQHLTPRTLLLGQRAGATRSTVAEEAISLTGHQGPVRDVAFSPDSPNGTGSRWLATGSGDGSARLWPLGQEALPDPAQAQRGPGRDPR